MFILFSPRFLKELVGRKIRGGKGWEIFGEAKGSTFFYAQVELDLFRGSEIVFENMKQIAHFCHVIRSVLINFISSLFFAGMNSRKIARFKVQQVFKNTFSPA